MSCTHFVWIYFEISKYPPIFSSQWTFKHTAYFLSTRMHQTSRKCSLGMTVQFKKNHKQFFFFIHFICADAIKALLTKCSSSACIHIFPIVKIEYKILQLPKIQAYSKENLYQGLLRGGEKLTRNLRRWQAEEKSYWERMCFLFILRKNKKMSSISNGKEIPRNSNPPQRQRACI